MGLLFRWALGNAEKKLTEAGRAWAFGVAGQARTAGSEKVSDAIAEEFRALNVAVPEARIEQDDEEADVFLVMPANWAGVTAFLLCETQWRFAAAGQRMIRTGIDYCALDVVLQRRGDGDQVFEAVRDIEAAALEALTEIRADSE